MARAFSDPRTTPGTSPTHFLRKGEADAAARHGETGAAVRKGEAGPAVRNDAASKRTNASSTRAIARLTALGGFGFAAGLFVQNGVLLAGAPPPGSSIGEIVRFYGANGPAVNASIAIAVVNLAFVFLFVNGLAHRLRGTPGEIWGRVATTGVAMLGGLFFLAVATQAVLSARSQSYDSVQVAVLWDLHSAAFAAAAAPLAITVGALALGLRHTSAPRWVTVVGLGSALLVPAGAGAAAWLVKGSPVLWIMMAGFALWVVFLVAASWAVLRDARRGEGPLGASAGVAG